MILASSITMRLIATFSFVCWSRLIKTDLKWLAQTVCRERVIHGTFQTQMVYPKVPWPIMLVVLPPAAVALALPPLPGSFATVGLFVVIG